jgi:hypothetical protein
VGRSDHRCETGFVSSVLLLAATNTKLRKSIKIQPSVIGYIAMGMAFVSKGEKDAGHQAYDIAFEHFHMSHVSFLLLIKVFDALELCCPSAAHFA